MADADSGLIVERTVELRRIRRADGWFVVAPEPLDEWRPRARSRAIERREAEEAASKLLGARTSVRIGKSEYRIGEPIQVTLSIHNYSPSTLWWDRGRGPDFATPEVELYRIEADGTAVLARMLFRRYRSRLLPIPGPGITDRSCRAKRPS